MADNLEIIKCPACECKMEKIFMPEQGVNIDVCPECGGTYFDNREFQKFDEKHEDITPLVKLFENKTYKKVDSSKTRVCPVCGTNMVKNYSSAKKQVEIDECYSCGGKFLDHDELEKIRDEYENEEGRAADVINTMYSTVLGQELIENQQFYEKRMQHKTLFSKIINMRYK